MNSEKLIKKILKTWHNKGLGKAKVAGGAPLSIKLKQTVNDIDLFVEGFNLKNETTLTSFMNFLCEVNASNIKLGKDRDYSDYKYSNVKGVHEFSIGKNNVQVIESSKGLDHFDIDLCKIYYICEELSHKPRGVYVPTGETVVLLHETEEHLKDLANKTLTVDVSKLSNGQLQKTLKTRLPKYIDRYGFTPVLMCPDSDYPLVFTGE